MIRVVLGVLLLVLAAAGGIWAHLTLVEPVTLPIGGARVDVRLGDVLIVLIGLTAILLLVLWLLASLFLLPKKLGQARSNSKTRKANQALTDGLLAAEAGDAKAAMRLAKKAAKHAEDDRLKLLLDARAAEASDDWSGAEQAWGQLSRLPGGQLAGLRGSATAAIERGDVTSAESRAREALTLKTDADWPFISLFDLQVSRGEWGAALETLALGERRGLIKGDSLRRRRAVLHTAHATNMDHADRQRAQKTLADAIRSAPGFPPAAWHGARHLMVDGKAKAAQGVLELAWKARPHPALAQLARRLVPGEDAGLRTHRLKALIASNPDHRESRVLKSELAIEADDWVTAIKTLALLVEENPTARLCLLMERALAGFGDTAESERWARMAATASREADWSDIDPRGQAFDYQKGDWARLVYAFGDVGDLVHPRYESYGRELEAGRAIALPAPADAPPIKAPSAPLAPPVDYALDDD